MREYFVYMLTNKGNSVLYTGVTNDIEHRTYEHKTGKGCIFSAKYKTTKLIYFKEYGYVYHAIDREKEIKGWNRKKKEKLINKENPLWEDLAKDWYDDI